MHIENIFKFFLQVHIDVVAPLIIVPLGLVLGTLHPWMTVFALVLMPISLLVCYKIWRQMKVKPKTQLFLAWGSVSVAQMYFTFQYVVIPLGKVSISQNVLLHFGVFAMFYCFFKLKILTHKNFIRHDQRFKPKNTSTAETINDAINSSKGDSSKSGSSRRNSVNSDVTINLNDESEFEQNVKEFGPMGAFMVKNFGMDKE